MNKETSQLNLLAIEHELNNISDADITSADINSCQVNKEKVNVAFGSVC